MSALMEKNPLLAMKLGACERSFITKSSWKTCFDGEFLIIFGVGDGSLFEEIQPWLKNRRVIWIAKDLLDAHGWSEEVIQHPNIDLCTLDEPDIINAALWESALKKRCYTIMEGLKLTDIQPMIEECAIGIELLLAKAKNFGWKEVENVLENIGSGFDGTKLFGTQKNVPAIICGAGPSLLQSIPELEKLQGKAHIFAGGSALGVLHEHGIKASFGLGCDPEPVRAQIEKGLETDTPFFFTADFDHELLSQVKGPKLQIKGSGALKFEQWFWENSENVLDLGWNVATMSAAIASAMGCNPIVFVGMDLAYSNESTKAAGVIDRENVEKIEAIDKHKNPCKTRRDLMMSAKWLEDLIKTHPEKIWIDATPVGLKIEGTVQQPLEFGSLQAMDFPLIENKDVSDKVGAMKKSILSCKKLIEENTKLSKIEFETEKFYIHHLKPLWEIFKPVFPDEAIHEYLFYKKVLEHEA